MAIIKIRKILAGALITCVALGAVLFTYQISALYNNNFE